MSTINPQDAKTALLNAIKAAAVVKQALEQEKARIQLEKQSKQSGTTTPPAPTKPLS